MRRLPYERVVLGIFFALFLFTPFTSFAAVCNSARVGGGDDFTTTCGANGKEDRAYVWTAPADGTYSFSTTDPNEAVLAIGNLEAKVAGHFEDRGDIIASGTVNIQTGSFTLFRSQSFDVTGECRLSGSKQGNSAPIRGTCVPGIQ